MIDLNDPRLTAFALGELNDVERREIEAAVQASPELQREVAAIQQSVNLLQESLGTEACPSLTAAQRATIADASDSVAFDSPSSDRALSAMPSPSSRAKRGSLRRTISLAVVASLLLVVVGGTAWVTWDPDRFAIRSVALRGGPAVVTEAVPSSGPAASVTPQPRGVPNDGYGSQRESNQPGDVRGIDGAVVEFGLGDAPAADLDLGYQEPETESMFGSGLMREKRVGEVEEERLGLETFGEPAEGATRGSSRSSRRGLGLVQDMPSEAVPFDADDKSLRRQDGGLPDDHLGIGRGFGNGVDDGLGGRGGMAGMGGGMGGMGGMEPDISGEMGMGGMMGGSEMMPGDSRGDESFFDRGRANLSGLHPLPQTNGPATSPAKPDADSSIDENELPAALKMPEELAEGETESDESGNGNLDFAAPSSEATKQKRRRELAKVENKNTWVRSRATPNASQLMIGDNDGLPLEGMQVNVLVDGFRARVLLDLYFFNNRGRQLEGNFKLRLPNEASLYYFAFGKSAYEYRPMVDQLASSGFLSGELIRAASLDPRGILKSRENSWTDVKEARVVPRAKAAHAYGETVRRRVDPALVEWSGAGVFNARVFPLMPNKLHRVVVGYDVNLQRQGDDLVYALDLPVDQGECAVDLNVSALPGVTAEVTPAARPFMSGGRAYYNFQDPADQAITVRFKKSGSMLLTGADEQAGEFFVSRITPELPADESSASSPRAVFLVDTSLSSRPEKFNIWLDMLEAVLTENRDSIAEFAVLFFNIESSWWQAGFRENDAKNVAQLLADCRELSLEGATDLRQALREATNPTWAQASAAENTPRPDLFLLSDGAATWGDLNVHRLSQTLQQAEAGPLFAYQTGMAGTAVGMLEHLTRESGGAVFSVINEGEVKQAAQAHRQRPWQLVDVALPGGSDILVAGRPKFIYPGQSLLITGRGTPDAQATIRLRRGNQQQVVELAIDRTLDSALAARVYGQVAVGQLEDLGSHVEDVAVAYARHFRVTGQTCSLLMLESEADYQRFNIKPEEDAFLVRTSPTAGLIATKLDELAEQLGDAKTTFTDWLSQLERTPGLQFKVPTALRLVLDRLPAEAFEVEPARLTCSQRTKEDAAPEWSRMLDTGKLDYTAVTGRAASRFEQLGSADALRTLSSLVENNPGDPVLTRDVAFSALQWGLNGQAYFLLKRVAELRPYEPQTYQAMSLCLAESGNADLAMIYYEVALNASWHNRYQDVKQIVGIEYVDLLRRIERGDVASHARDYAVARLETMRGRVPVNKADLVVTMMWNTDRTDVDLHVIEPTGEECYYEHPRTRMGGQMTRDVTEGFGPEMYTLAKAKAGDYRILAKFYARDANRTSVRSKVYVTVYRNYGDPKRQWIEKTTVTLADQKEKRELVTVKVKP